MITLPKFEDWEVNQTHLWAERNGVAHICEGISRDYPIDDDYVATFACGFAASSFHSITRTTGFYARTTLKLRRCRKCVAEMRRRHPNAQS